MVCFGVVYRCYSCTPSKTVSPQRAINVRNNQNKKTSIYTLEAVCYKYWVNFTSGLVIRTFAESCNWKQAQTYI